MLERVLGSRDGIRGVIHVGAHYGQECPLYEKFEHVLLFEPVPESFRVLAGRAPPRFELVNLAVGNSRGSVTMFLERANSGMSSSVLRPTGHLVIYPHIVFEGEITVEQVTLDGFLGERGWSGRYHALVIDVQGYELEVLRGAATALQNDIEVVVTEVYRDELYAGCARIGKVDDYMAAHGFRRTETAWDGSGTWGDAVYERAAPREHDAGRTRDAAMTGTE